MYFMWLLARSIAVFYIIATIVFRAEISETNKESKNNMDLLDSKNAES